MDKVMYVIAQLGRPKRDSCSFISELSHEFKGYKEVLGYNNLDNALKWETEGFAKKHLAELPDWAKNKHRVYHAYIGTLGWEYYIESPNDHFEEFMGRQVSICHGG